MKKNIRTVFSAGLILLLAGSMVLPAFAMTKRFEHNHPRRAEVLRRDNRMTKELREDRGHLDGHYKQLMSEDRAIRRQERREAKANGGYITKAEQRQLNHKENHLKRQIRHDSKG